jgi:hypothetical protein
MYNRNDFVNIQPKSLPPSALLHLGIAQHTPNALVLRDPCITEEPIFEPASDFVK